MTKTAKAPFYAALGLVAASVLTACNRPDPRDAEIRRLTEELQKAKAAPSTTSWGENDPVAPPPGPQFLLVVSWPNKGGNDLRQPYQNLATCEAAKQAIMDDATAQSEAAALARRQEAEAAGVQIVIGAERPLPSASCLPL